MHVNDVGAAIEAGIRAGPPHRITVTRFADAAGRRRRRRDGRAGRSRSRRAAGLAELFAAEGRGGRRQAAPAPPAEVLAPIETTGAGEVVVLPNDADVSGGRDAAAEQARAVGIEVAVVPIRAAVQGLAALAVHDAARRFDDDVIAMAEAAAATPLRRGDGRGPRRR